MRRMFPVLAVAVVALVMLLTAQPSSAITGGTEDTANQTRTSAPSCSSTANGDFEGVCSGTLLSAGRASRRPSSSRPATAPRTSLPSESRRRTRS